MSPRRAPALGVLLRCSLPLALLAGGLQPSCVIRQEAADPVDPTTSCPQDRDCDGLSDSLEEGIGSNPTAADSDNDGLGDAAEVGGYPTSLNRPPDADGDELPDVLESRIDDADNDGAPDQLDGPGPGGDQDGDGILV